MAPKANAASVLSGARLAAQLAALPGAPGVYVFRGAGSLVLYIGKARNLRSRVRSYFNKRSGDGRYFIPYLADALHAIETVLVASEKEAALLENQLIKELHPKYNFKLRDDKEFLSLRLDPTRPWPRLEVVRKPPRDGVRYYGPYPSATAARQTLRVVNRHFSLRTCTDTEFKRRTRPCLQYQIKRCPGPCAVPVDRDEYQEQVRLVGLFLDGRHDEVTDTLRQRMLAASTETAYERAARYRDQLHAVEQVREKQHVAELREDDQDVVGLHRQADQGQVAVLLVRGGRITGVRTYDLQNLSIPDPEVLATFLREYYREGAFLPDEVLLPTAIDVMDGFADLLSERRGKRVHLLVPKRGPRQKLIGMATENAAHAFEERARTSENIAHRLAEVQRQLHLDAAPRQLECIDISHSGGQDAVAAIVALEDGKPARQRYRSFTLRNTRAGDDYGAMFEALSRRFLRSTKGEAAWEAPDLLVVDGGKGQLRVALKVLSALNITVPAVGLAKERVTSQGDALEDRIYLAGAKNPIPLRSHAALQMLALARDEAHRFANLQRTRKEKKRSLKSELEDVPGVGPKTRNRLLRALGSLRALEHADEACLVAAGASAAQAKAIRQWLGNIPEEGGVDPVTDEEGAEDLAIDNAFS